MEFIEALNNFTDTVQKMINEAYSKNFTNLPPPYIKVEYGRRYVKVIKEGVSQRQVYCFIDKNGDILKAASWKAPAKGVRGNIYVPFGDAITLYGAMYNV